MGTKQSKQVQPIEQITHEPQRKTPQLKVLNKEEAIIALEKANKRDFFLDEVARNELNRKARASLIYYPATLQDSISCCNETTDINNTLLVRSEDLPLKQDISIIWMDPTAEGGMPHTRPPNIICLPMYYPNNALYKTLLHELVHIDQRQNVAKWIEWCIYNGWTIVDTDEIPDRWLRRCRLNPDTLDFRFWAYHKRWVPLPMFEREDRPNMREVQVKWWDKRTGELLIHPPSEILYHIKGIGVPEHPFEIAAYNEVTL